jgi:RNA polymerase sigma factor (sigma-70 family)
MNRVSPNGNASDTPAITPEEWRLRLSQPAERKRLVRLCARITGDPHAAEDLAQVALVEAWRNRHALRDPESWQPFLTGIARNACRRWHTRRSRERRRIAPLTEPDEDRLAYTEDHAAWEQEEMAGLLERALDHLEPEMRAALTERYLHGLPAAEVAARLGITENTLGVRLHRGKGLLRRVIETRFPEEASAYGLLGTRQATTGWQETGIWCPYCGAHRLKGRFDTRPGHEEFRLTCPHCTRDFGGRGIGAAFTAHQATLDFARVLGGVRTFRPALWRVHSWWGGHFARSLAERQGPCITCGRPTALTTVPPPGAHPHQVGQRGVYKSCAHCRHVFSIPPKALALMHPEVQRFWRGHSRMHCLPSRELPLGGGHSAVLTRFESVTDRAAVEVLTAREDFRVLSVSAG